MSGYPYVDFHNAANSIHMVDCDNTDVRYTCPYLKFLENQGYTDYQIDRMGRITIVHLNFWRNYSAKKKSAVSTKFLSVVSMESWSVIGVINKILRNAGFFYKNT